MKKQRFNLKLKQILTQWLEPKDHYTALKMICRIEERFDIHVEITTPASIQAIALHDCGKKLKLETCVYLFKEFRKLKAEDKTVTVQQIISIYLPNKGVYDGLYKKN